MMREEFEKRIGAEISPADYAEIEYVYNYHPAIPEVGGKDVIAEIYKAGGLGVIRSMHAVAEMAETAEKTIMEKRKEIEKLQKEIADIRGSLKFYAAKS